MNIRNLHKSPWIRKTIIGLGIVILALLIFRTGVFVGYHKARFGARFGDSYHHNFVDPHRGGFGHGFGGGDLSLGGHGAIGTIVSVSLPQIVVAGRDNLEKTILLTDDTLVRQFKSKVMANSLKVGDSIVVLGVPNEDGQIEAKLIRIVPTPPAQSTTTQPTQ